MKEILDFALHRFICALCIQLRLAMVHDIRNRNQIHYSFVFKKGLLLMNVQEI